MFRRETLIALRARRTAYRIAIDFLFPRLRTIETAMVVLPPKEPEPGPHEEEIEELRGWLHITVMFAALIALVVVMLVLAIYP